MKKKFLSLLLVLCMVISLMSTAAFASPSYRLYIGETNVTDYTHAISYWNADDGVYSKTGNESDYDFSVSYSSGTESFTLTLNGVDIVASGDYDGISCRASLNIVLADGTDNSITATSNGIYADGNITIEGQGSLTVTSVSDKGVVIPYGGIDIYSGTIVFNGPTGGIFAQEYVNIEGGTLTAVVTGSSAWCDSIYTNGTFSLPSHYQFLTNTTESAPDTDYTYYPGEAFDITCRDYKYVKIKVPDVVYVGSTLVSSTTEEVSYWKNDGEGGITSTGANEDNYNATYDNTSNTLTLNALDLTNLYNASDESYGIYSNGPLNMVLADGTNSSINTVTTQNAICMNIKAEGDITIEGDGGLSLYAETVLDEATYTTGIYSYEDITVNGGAVTITANNTSDILGLSSGDGDITINGGSVFIDANNAWSSGIGISSRNIRISGGTVISLNGNCNSTSYGLSSSSGGIDITGGTVYATGSMYGGTAIKSYNGNIAISGGTVFALTVSANGYGHGLDVYNGIINITGGAVYATGGINEVDGTALYTSEGNINVGDYDGSFDNAVVIMTDSDSFIPTVLYNGSNLPDFGAYVDVVFTGGFPFGCGNIWNTESGKVYGNFDASPSHNYTWSTKYNSEYKIFDLTLNGFDMTSYSDDERGIATDASLNLMLKGENSIGAEANPYYMGIYCADNMTVSAENGGSLDIITSQAGINTEGAVSFLNGAVSIIADDMGMQIIDGDLTISGGNVTITAGEVGIQTEGTCDVIVSGSETVLNITAGEEDAHDEFYGIYCDDGMVIIDDATVSIENLGRCGDGVHAESDIRISGDTQVKIIDWSKSDYSKCGLHSQRGNIAIGGSSDVDIVSQSTGIYTKYVDDTYIFGDIYIGYEWDGTSYIPSGSPTVKINDEDSIAAVTPLDSDDFIAGSHGIRAAFDVHIAGGNIEINANNEDASFGIYTNNILEITGGSVTAFGTEQALYADREGEPITVDIPSYKHRTNTDASVPATPFLYYPDTSFDVNSVENYKYVNIASTYAVDVTFNSNGTVYDTKTVNIGDSIGSATWPANPTRNSYTFDGWFTGANGTGTEFTSSTPINSTITLYAKWTYSGSNDSTPPPPQRTITVTETSSEVFTNTAGTITAEANMDNAFSNSVEVKVTDTDEDTGSFNLSAGDEVYPFDISLYIKGTNTRTEPSQGYAVTISLPIPENLIDKRTSLLVVHKSDDGTVTTLNSRLVQKNGVWYLVFEATEFSPYALVIRNSKSYKESEGVPYYTDVKGNKVFIGFAANGKYIAPDGATISLMQNDKSFTDVSGHWAASSIGFTTERELFFGTGGNKFSPDIGMTRAMFATVIGRLYERSFGEIATSDTHTFLDCDYDVYYGKYADWAAENRIIAGIGDSKFAPDALITREQMAAILYRFADFLGVLPSGIDTTLKYPDTPSISEYAKDAALYCQTTGVIVGRSGEVFAPQETATRAEVVAIIQRFIETVMK